MKPVIREETKRDEQRKRTMFGVPAAKLGVAPIDGFHLHWVNDYPGRVDEAINGGYEFVDRDEVQLAYSGTTSANADLGTRVSRLVGKNEDGSALNAYLMKIRLDWYNEGQNVIQGKIDEVESHIKRGLVKGVEGNRQYSTGTNLTHSS